MSPGNRPVDGLDYSADSDGSGHSFHDLLLNRSKEALASRRQKPVSTSVDRKVYVEWSIRLIRLVGEVANFSGGLAVGAGVVLLIRGEPIRGFAGGSIALGLGMVFLSISSRLLTRPRPVPWTREAAGG